MKGAEFTVRAAAVATLFLAGCATPIPPHTAVPLTQPVSLTEAAAVVLGDQWGIEITSLCLSAHGRMVDFRYRVLDPAKAATLGKRENKPRLIDQATGSILFVPNTPKLGPLRQSAARLIKDKIYFVLFANTRSIVKSGSMVTVSIGEFKAENLVVQ